jgi:hypothetical protein
MPNYEVTVHRTLYLSLQIKAATKEEAGALAREQIEEEFGDVREWDDYEPLDIEYDVMMPSMLNQSE